jgi:hypothetical protein
MHCAQLIQCPWKSERKKRNGAATEIAVLSCDGLCIHKPRENVLYCEIDIMSQSPRDTGRENNLEKLIDIVRRLHAGCVPRTTLSRYFMRTSSR